MTNRYSTIENTVDPVRKVALGLSTQPMGCELSNEEIAAQSGLTIREVEFALIELSLLGLITFRFVPGRGRVLIPNERRMAA